VLDTLIEFLSASPHDALIIAGDIYDRSIPSPESVELLNSFLSRLRRKCPDLEICILSGNHDSAARLGFGRELLGREKVHIASEPGESETPVLIKTQDALGNEESCAIFLLPFLSPGSLAKEGVPVQSQALLAEEAALRLEAARKKAQAEGALWTVVAAHLFMQGGTGSDSERIFLGSAEQVDPRLFEGFDYAALGHLHSFQKAGGNAWYSGSPLAYSFSESNQDKVFISLECTRSNGEKNITLEKIPLRPLHPLRSLTGSFDDFLSGKIEADPEAYLEIRLSGAELVENPLGLLRPRFPLIMSVRQDRAFSSRFSTVHEDAETIKSGSLEDDFNAFLTELYGAAGEEKTALFAGLLQEMEHEAP
jgi:exonuclease SbcD